MKVSDFWAQFRKNMHWHKVQSIAPNWVDHTTYCGIKIRSNSFQTFDDIEMLLRHNHLYIHDSQPICPMCKAHHLLSKI
jgi:hypothetical protein